MPKIIGHCTCKHGFYGEACRYECPGEGSNPCYGKGTCNTTNGECSCDVGADQNSSCRTCTQGWFGSDCKFALAQRGL